jgi:hypothetical protein
METRRWREQPDAADGQRPSGRLLVGLETLLGSTVASDNGAPPLFAATRRW